MGKHKNNKKSNYFFITLNNPHEDWKAKCDSYKADYFLG